MKQYIVVNVTELDIADGLIDSASACPIALAMKREGYNCIAVNEMPGGEVQACRGDWEKVFPLTKAAQRFTDRFDAEKSVKPTRFRFALDKQYYDPLPVDCFLDEDLSGYDEDNRKL